MKREFNAILATILAGVFMTPWFVNIAYSFWLGYSRNEWLDDKFFYWESSSFFLLAIGFVGIPVSALLATIFGRKERP